MLRGDGFEVDALRPPAGEVPVRLDGEMTWVAARPGMVPALGADRQYGSPAEIDALDVIADGVFYVWAWIDEDARAGPGALLRAPRRESTRTRRRARPPCR